MDSLEFIIHVETEGFDPHAPEQVEALQWMIDSGLIWQLQGWWQRFAYSMIKAGIVKPLRPS